MSEQRKKVDEKENLKPERLVAELLKDLRYGTLEIVVHDGRIVQVERREKLRFDGCAK